MKYIILLLCLIHFSCSKEEEQKPPESRNDQNAAEMISQEAQLSEPTIESFSEFAPPEMLSPQAKNLSNFSGEFNPGQSSGNISDLRAQNSRLNLERIDRDISLQMEELGRYKLEIDFEHKLGSKPLLRLKDLNGDSHIVGDDDTAPVNAAVLPALVGKAYPNLGKPARNDLESKITSISKSVCLITSKNKLFNNQPLTAPYGKIHKLKDTEPLFNMPSIIKDGNYRNATGFLIGENRILTARHVIKDVNLDDLRIIFNYKLSHYNPLKAQRVRSSDVYKVSRVVNQGGDGYAKDRTRDWCILELDRIVESSQTLQISDRKINHGQKLMMVGHPDGMPLTVSLKGKLLSGPSSFNHSYQCSLDSFHGNSGSPIFTYPNFELIGLYVAGKKKDVRNNAITRSEENSDKIIQSFTSISHLISIINEL